MMNNYSNFNYMDDMRKHNYKGYSSDGKLKSALAMQAGDNMNFNKCDYNQENVSANKLYDVYQGFISGNMFPDLYNGYKGLKPYEVMPANEQAEMLTYIDAYGFAAHDLNLYLDTHPDDENMIRMFRQYSEQCMKIVDEYEKKYGPILVSASVSYPWAWNNSPWPWENS